MRISIAIALSTAAVFCSAVRAQAQTAAAEHPMFGNNTGTTVQAPSFQSGRSVITEDHRGIGIGQQGSGTAIAPLSSEPMIAPQINEPAIGQQGTVLPGLSDQGLIFPAPNTIVVGPRITTTGVMQQGGIGIGMQTPFIPSIVERNRSAILRNQPPTILPGLSDQGLITPDPNAIMMQGRLNPAFNVNGIGFAVHGFRHQFLHQQQFLSSAFGARCQPGHRVVFGSSSNGRFIARPTFSPGPQQSVGSHR